MAVTYSVPGETEWPVTLLASVMKQHHPRLAEVGVRVGLLMAVSDNDAPAVKHGGYGATATVKVVPLKDRLTKEYDAEMLVDEGLWKEFSRERQAALLDHELSHLRVVEKGGEPQLDDLGRPKLKTVRADINSGDAFEAVVERHGAAALEVRNAEVFYAFIKRAQAGE